MAWSWSHTNEAYDNAYKNLLDLEHETLAVIWAEWQASTRDEFYNYDLDLDRYDDELAKARELPGDILADAIWEQASELATCTNGGWEAWMCPHGCGCHMVSFSREETCDANN